MVWVVTMGDNYRIECWHWWRGWLLSCINQWREQYPHPPLRSHNHSSLPPSVPPGVRGQPPHPPHHTTPHPTPLTPPVCADNHHTVHVWRWWTGGKAYVNGRPNAELLQRALYVPGWYWAPGKKVHDLEARGFYWEKGEKGGFQYYIVY